MESKPKEQFVDQSSAELFFCPTCFEEVPHFDNYVETKCGHYFCKQHKPDLNSNCPVCREKISEYVESASIKRFIKNLKLYCDYRESGCEWRGAWCELEKHLEICLYFPIQCKWNNCKKTVPRSTINQHESQCEWRIVKCQYCNVEKPFNSISVSYNHSLNFNFLETS